MSGYQCLYCRNHDPAPRSGQREPAAGASADGAAQSEASARRLTAGTPLPAVGSKAAGVAGPRPRSVARALRSEG